MSYILDALRRADRERSRGAPADIHAETLHSSRTAPAGGRKLQPWIWLIAGLCIGVLGVSAWRVMDISEPAGPAPLPIAAVPPQPQPQPAPAPAPAPAIPAAGSAAAPNLRFLPPRPPPSAIVALQDLSEAPRRQLGGLKLGGAIHSTRAADRLLIVDGQVVREGDSVAPGVVLEQIRPRSAIFRLGQDRVEVQL